MILEIYRFLFLVFPYVICTTLAAVIIWKEDIKLLLPKILIYSLLASLIQTLTYQIHFEAVRFIVELLGGLLVAILVFRTKLGWILRIYITSYFFGFVTAYLVCLVTASLLKQPMSYLCNSKEAWLWFVIPINLLTIPFAYMIRKWSNPLIESVISFKQNFTGNYSIIFAVTVQIFIYSTLVSLIIFNPKVSQNTLISVLLLSVLIILGLSIFVIVKYIHTSNKEIMAATQDAVSDNIMELLNSVRGQRHDFLNHLQVIDYLYHRGEQPALEDYLSKLLNEVSNYSEILKIDNPVIAAVLNTKVSKADSQGIRIEANIQASFEHLTSIALDLARILSNLLDNALEAIEQEGVEKIVYIDILDRGPMILVSIKNHFNREMEEMQTLFTPGFTNKEEGHEGIGLQICQQLTNKLYGNLETYIDPVAGLIVFNVFVPKLLP